MTFFGAVGVLCIVSVSVVGSLPTGAALVALGQQTFNSMDTNQDGSMTKTEWDVLKAVTDPDMDGCMTLSEFQKVFQASADVVSGVYKIVDKGNSGCITEQQLDREFDLMDLNGDGTVSGPEFNGFFLKLMNQVEFMIAVG